MLFSRIIVAAVAFVSAAHALSLNPPRPQNPTPRDVPTVSAAVSPLVDATNKLHALRPKVADAMAGPREDREVKFIDISGQALQITKHCNDALKSQSVLSKMTDAVTSDEMTKFSRAMFRVLRSCKGIRNTQIASTVDQIMDQMEVMQTTVKGAVPSLASLLGNFDINFGRLSAISAALAS
ncbi:hypothetical protein FRC10_002618 [Ceratobasidium sp. 414]|nr:hypothetical protein FRC10_002618 [Ceratobasidium sp. 414]